MFWIHSLLNFKTHVVIFIIFLLQTLDSVRFCRFGKKMPRPGPRPFECVRRSWHSDRHQPVRGSVIQQIFRVVHENHSPGTKKNREWQEKLPLVVLKSEEIMYSKANSEAEYLDPETLWDRVNDAINTIIRKDDSMETGEFLPPCVEAALNLGCVPVRSSRSERNSNTRSYLSSRNQDSTPTPTKTTTIASNTRNFNLPNIDRLHSNTNPHLGSSFHHQNFTNIPKKASFEGMASSVFPLYHGFHLQPQVPHMGPLSTHQAPTTIIVGRPVFQAAHERLPPCPPAGLSEKLFSFDRGENGSKNESRPKLGECDLSLRLGLVSSDEKGLTCVENVDLSSSSRSSFGRKEFAFFPLSSGGGEVENLVTNFRKRKTVEEAHCFMQLEPDFKQINEQTKRRGL